MKTKIALAARLILGLIFFVFGLNGFFKFIPMPPLPADAGAFMMALAGTGYFFPVLKITETLMGALLLAGCCTPLALVILTPIILQILLFHIFLATAGLPMAIVIVLLHGFLTYCYWPYFQGVLTCKTEVK